MEIERHLVKTTPAMSIEEFAEMHSLVMEINERSQVPVGDGNRFYAHFKHAETKTSNMLLGEYGDGSNEAEAIENYASKISQKLLVIDAYGGGTRREIQVPILEPKQ